jgi:hypothetical protein
MCCMQRSLRECLREACIRSCSMSQAYACTICTFARSDSCVTA